MEEKDRHSAQDQLTASTKAFENIIAAVQRKNDKIKELLSLEEKYLEDLETVSIYYDEVKKSKAEENDYPIKMPDGLRKGRDAMVFGNIKGLHDFHNRIFTVGMTNSQNDAAKILELFKKRKSDLMFRYGKYSINYPRSELIVKQFQTSYFTKMETHLEQSMRLADHLIKPVQHLMRYSMLLKELVNHCKNAEQNDEAKKFLECYQIATEITKNVNEMMEAGRIEMFPGDITKQGELISRGSVFCKVPSPKRSIFSRRKESEKFEPCQIFIFQQSVVICYHSWRETEVDIKNEYKYWHKFQINEMQVRESPKGQDELMFELHDSKADSLFPNLLITTKTLKEKMEMVEKINTEIKQLEGFTGLLGNPTMKL